MRNTNLNEFFNFDYRKVEKIDHFDHWKIPHDEHTPKIAQNLVFPESGSGKHFHASAMRAIDSTTRKTLERSKISSKIDFYNQISTF